MGAFEIVQVTEDQLVGALDALDVPFLSGGVRDAIALALTPEALLTGLAQSGDARVRSAIIPLLLRHPEFAPFAEIAATQRDIARDALVPLRCFYTAAVLLQKKYAERLARLFGEQAPLPDLFGRALQLELSDDIGEALMRLGKRNAELSGLDLNWAGGYNHAAITWLKHIELHTARRNQQVWQKA